MKMSLRQRALVVILASFMLAFLSFKQEDKRVMPKICGEVVKKYTNTKKTFHDEGKTVVERYYVGFQFPDRYKPMEISPIQYEDMRKGQRYCFDAIYVTGECSFNWWGLIASLSCLTLFVSFLVYVFEFIDDKNNERHS